MASERLQKIIAGAGITSRRKAEEMITGGRVSVNGQVVTELGSKADPETDEIRVDGKAIEGHEQNVYIVLNKPKGYVTTVSDPEGRPTVMDLIKPVHARVYPVGRLDYGSEGLLLLTNDGDLANKLTHASSNVPKTYLVKVAGAPDEEALERLRRGVTIAAGNDPAERLRTAPAQIELIRKGDNPWFEVTIIEGRNRQIRKMFEEIGHHVEKIKRVKYGPLELDVHPGEFRMLNGDEVKRLKLAADGAPLPAEKPKKVTAASFVKKAARPASARPPRREFKRTGDRPPRREFKAGEGRPARREFQGSEDRPARPAFRSRDGEPRGERPPRREFGQRPAFRSDRPPRREAGRQAEGARPRTPPRFSADGRPPGEFPKRERPPRREFGKDRGPRKEFGGTRPPRREFRSRDESSPRGEFRPKRNFAPREGQGDRPPRREFQERGERGARPPRGDFRPRREREDSPAGDRPRGNRPPRPFNARGREERGERAGAPRRERPAGERPAKPPRKPATKAFRRFEGGGKRGKK